MKYSEIKNKIKSGDVLVWGHRTWGTWADFKNQIARILCRSDYMHTGTAWVVGDRIFVIESVLPVVRITLLSSSLAECYWMPMDLEERWVGVEDYALAAVGTARFSTTEAYMQMVKGGSPVANGKWFCSKFTNELLRRMGVTSCPHPVHPSALVDHLRNMGKVLYKII